MNESGCKISDIGSAKYMSIETAHSQAIIEAFIISGIKYHAKYSDTKLTLAYSAEDEERVSEIITKSSSDNAELIERYRTEGAGANELFELLPEIAEVMGVSVSALENRPLELRLYLAQAYINTWFSDKVTLQNELEKVTELGYYSKVENDEHYKQLADDNNTPKARKAIQEDEQRLDNAAAVERKFYHQQRIAVDREERRTQGFTVEKLRREARRIKKSASENSTQEHELTETEDIMVRKK